MKKQRKGLKWLVLGAVIIGVITIGIGTSIYLINDASKKNKIENNNKEQDVKDNDEKPEVNDIMNDKEQNIEESEIKPEETIQQEEVQQKPVEVQNKTENTNNNVTNTKPKENNTQVQKPVEQPKPVEEQKPVEQPKPKTPWEELGISEYDYYNSPSINWQTVDVDINEYSSYDEAKQACYEKGANRTDLGKYKFRCDDVYTHSGKLLGFYIKYTVY